MSFKPTTEQNTCVTSYGKKISFKVEAVAGSGKTSTVNLMADSDHSRTALYLAFNKAAATEAGSKMPFHVVCKTTHSIAYSKFGATYKDKLSRPRHGYVNVAGTVGEITRYFRVRSTGSMNKNNISRLAKLMVSAFESSASFTLDAKHIPQGELNILARKAKLKDEVFDMDSAVSTVMKIAYRLWEERIDLTSPVLITHDTYLKLYQLSKPVLDYDVIFLDEAQDTSDCVIDIVLRQDDHAQVVCVGDSFQAIYGWRGAVNALGKIKSQSTSLSQSFRYGPKVAAVATAILNGAMVVKGFDKIPTEVGTVDRNQPYTMLFRTNAALIEEGLMLIQQGVSVDLNVNIKGYVKMLESASELYKGNLKKVKHEDICIFETWDDLMEEAELVKGELARVAKKVEDGEAQEILRILSDYTRPWDADITLTTAHKSKGFEYEQVLLADDFPDVMDDEGNFKELNDMERNLLYVAATRAQGMLELNRTASDIIEQRKKDVDCDYQGELDSLFDKIISKHVFDDSEIDDDIPF